jgi:hypothetical protein
MRIKAKITPKEKATNRRESQKYAKCAASGMLFDGIAMRIRNVYFNGKLNDVLTYDFTYND